MGGSGIPGGEAAGPVLVFYLRIALSENNSTLTPMALTPMALLPHLVADLFGCFWRG